MFSRSLRKFFIDYDRICLFTLILLIIVCCSYAFSRFIPADLFQHTISPIMHICLLSVTVIGAIVMHFHIEGIFARRIWQEALIAWVVLELIMLLLEKLYPSSTPIGGVIAISRIDFVARDTMAVILLAYPMEVLCPKWLTWWRGVLLVLPSLVISALDMLIQEDLRALLIVYPLLIASVLFVKIREYRAKFEENYSSLENSAMPWLWIYLVILTIIGLSYFYLCFTYHPTRLFTQQWLVLLLLTYNTVQIVIRRKPWQEIPQDESTEEADSRWSEYRVTMDEWMEKEKPYLNKDFRLVDLMQVLPLNRTYLSNFIHAEYGCSFYQYVTNYRIEEAKRLMRECPDLKLQEVAEKAGFSSATMFSRIFVRETGNTPTEWLESIDNS